MRIHASFSLLATLVAALPAHALELGLPIDCTLGSTCFVQNFVDHDATADYTDYTCGRLSYDGHKGTDFRLLNLSAMQAGVNVLAAADGTVRGFRDGMPDTNVNEGGRAAIKDRECGNGVVLTHPGGFETQYCHLKQGSIAVTSGQTVKAGEVLGKVGLSGFTVFPHVHFEVRQDGHVVDPFTGEGMTNACTTQRGASLWRADVKESLRYQHTGLLGAGFTTTAPSAQQIEQGIAPLATLAPDAPALIFWMNLFGLLPGDTLSLTLTAPDGSTLAEKTQPFTTSKATYFAYIGKQRRGAPWPTGTYTGHLQIKRGTETTATALQHSFTVDVR